MIANARSHTTDVKCLIDGCDSYNIEARGLCHGCYQKAMAMVQRRETTWEQLEQLGLVKPVRHNKSPFREAFTKAVATQTAKQ